ncbi:hypothetical protein AAFC00_004427 [Neodothiora populina]|uniref:Ribonuclease T2-like n=1 Tax=Neodothiora populina TaxID=2781224 RepID=A0ABR3P246_9PEZI
MTNQNLMRIAAAAVLAISSATSVIAASETCSSSIPLSCGNTTVVKDLCCFNAPGGQLLQTQFWDTDPSTGPSDSWTIHGLWPDHCDGTYDANCDSARAYTNITQILTKFEKTDLLSYMKTYWPDYQGNDESFWEHEWSKHGTCISTLKPSCYAGYVATQEVPDFFQRTVDLFKTLPSYTWLAAAGITPSSTETYTSAQIQAALSAHHDNLEVTLGCTSSALTEIWYSFHVQGSVQTGDFVAASPDGSKSTCPSTGVKYLPKSGKTATSTTKTATAASTTLSTVTGTSTGSTFSGKGYLNVITSSGATEGCLISGGTWLASATCATYTVNSVTETTFTLKSSKGYCGIVSNAFTCSSSVTSSSATVFVGDGSYLESGAGDTWSADSTSSGSTQVSVYSTGSHSVQLRIQFQSI